MTIPKRYYRRPEAADYLRLSAGTLRVWASQGKGPRYHKVGARVVYDVADLDAFVQASEYENEAA